MDYYSSLFASKVSGGGGGGSGEWTTDGIMDGSEPNGNLVFSTATAITKNALRDRTAINSVKGNSVISIGQSAFESSLIETIDFPVCTSIGASAFRKNTALKSINLPSLVTANNTYVFEGCTALTSVHFPLLESMGSNFFDGCTSLASVSLPKLKTVENSSLKSCSFPLVVLPSAQKITTYGLSNNSSLKTVDLGTKGKIEGGSVFINDTVLDTLILRINTEICPCTNVNHFNNTPFASGKSGGTLYVPSALISSYQSATNWSTILGYPNNQIKAIEGSIYENAYADGTPIS